MTFKTTPKFWIAILLILVLLQGFFSIGLLMLSYSDTFGLKHTAAQGERLLEKLTRLDQRDAGERPSNCLTTTIGGVELLTTSNNALREMARFLGSTGSSLLTSALIQLVGLIFLWRRWRADDRLQQGQI